MFCRHFSASQRLRAIELSRLQSQDLNETKEQVLPDEAVELVMKEARQEQNSRYKSYGDSNTRNRKPITPYQGRSNRP